MPEGGRRARRAGPVARTVADARFAKPLDADLVRRLAREHEVLITIEEGAIGGFGATCCSIWRRRGLLDRGLKIRPMCCPTASSTTTRRPSQYDEAGLNAPQIVGDRAGAALGRQRRARSAGG